jgi:DNA-binding PadR family transcriptional regulator
VERDSKGCHVRYHSSIRTSSPRNTRRITLTEAAVLALLAIEGERSGYDLLTLVRRSIGHVWAPAKTQLYAVLHRVARDGLATSRRVAQEQRPDKELYRLTQEGRAALRAWLDDDTDTSQDGFYFRLFVGGLSDPDRLLEQVEAFRGRAAEQLAVYRAIEPSNTRRGHDAYHWFLLDLGIRQEELKLRWADGVLDALRARAA